jgi:DNA-directed RNA polymerase specialized sigma24 family protein
MSANMSQTDHLIAISQKLDAVLGFLAVRGVENDPAAIFERLNGAGFSYKAIALVSGMSENAVAIRASRAKKKKGKAVASPAPTG